MAAPIILCDCTGMDNDRWLECRAHGPKGDIEYTVGGSDVATIFGLSPWTTPLELWMIKKGRMKPKTPPNPDQLAMGHMLEPIAAHFYARRSGNLVSEDNHLYQHAPFPLCAGKHRSALYPEGGWRTGHSGVQEPDLPQSGGLGGWGLSRILRIAAALLSGCAGYKVWRLFRPVGQQPGS